MDLLIDAGSIIFTINTVAIKAHIKRIVLNETIVKKGNLRILLLLVYTSITALNKPNTNAIIKATKNCSCSTILPGATISIV